MIESPPLPDHFSRATVDFLDRLTPHHTVSFRTGLTALYNPGDVFRHRSPLGDEQVTVFCVGKTMAVQRISVFPDSIPRSVNLYQLTPGATKFG